LVFIAFAYPLHVTNRLPGTPVIAFASNQKRAYKGMESHTSDMRASFKKIWQLAQSYLDTRSNDIHTMISVDFAYELVERDYISTPRDSGRLMMRD
jgi:hypothetical protein